jgi:short subunit fatty acids transporter
MTFFRAIAWGFGLMLGAMLAYGLVFGGAVAFLMLLAGVFK